MSGSTNWVLLFLMRVVSCMAPSIYNIYFPIDKMSEVDVIFHMGGNQVK